MKEDAMERSSRYLANTTDSLKRLKRKKQPTILSGQHVDRVLELVQGYTRDAQHYAQNRKPVTSLACIAYAEGLLDALKFLELIDL